MMRGMFAAISGLKQHQVMLDVTANDIANVNTIGYKSARVTFEDSLTQLQRGPPARHRQRRLQRRAGRSRRRPRLDRQPDDAAARPRRPATRSTSRSRATASSRSPRATRPGALPDAPTAYTRAGNFSITPGFLTTQTGQYVARLRRRRRRQPDRTERRDQDPGRRDRRRDRPERRRLLHRPGHADPRHPVPPHAGDVREPRRPRARRRQPWVTSANSGVKTVSTPGLAGLGATTAGAIEMSNVDLASTFTNMITAQRGFQANSRVISTADEMLEDLVNLKR